MERGVLGVDATVIFEELGFAVSRDLPLKFADPPWGPQGTVGTEISVQIFTV